MATQIDIAERRRTVWIVVDSTAAKGGNPSLASGFPPDDDGINERSDSLARSMRGDAGAQDTVADPLSAAPLAADVPWRGLVVAARPVFVAECRSFVRDALDAWCFPELIDTVQICTSELITNAMLYGDGS